MPPPFTIEKDGDGGAIIWVNSKLFLDKWGLGHEVSLIAPQNIPRLWKINSLLRKSILNANRCGFPVWRSSWVRRILYWDERHYVLDHLPYSAMGSACL